MNEPLESEYFNWLCAKVIVAEVPTPSLTYYRLLRQLQNTEFVFLLSGDDNRAADGVDLRIAFLRAAFIPDPGNGWLDIPCSVLEMLIAFAKTCEFETEDSITYWFWTFIENLDLAQYNDASRYHESVVADILHRFVWRLYEPNGQGGMFPLRDPQQDQREVEIWYQFCEYLIENE